MRSTYSVREAAGRIGCPESTLYEQCREGRVPHLKPFRVGNRWYLPRRLVDALVGGEAA